MEAGPTAEEDPAQIQMATAKEAMPFNDERTYYDEYTALPLPIEGVRKSRQLEMDFMNELKVWRFERKSVACADGSMD